MPLLPLPVLINRFAGITDMLTVLIHYCWTFHWYVDCVDSLLLGISLMCWLCWFFTVGHFTDMLTVLIRFFRAFHWYVDCWFITVGHFTDMLTVLIRYYRAFHWYVDLLIIYCRAFHWYVDLLILYCWAFHWYVDCVDSLLSGISLICCRNPGAKVIGTINNDSTDKTR